VTVAVTVISGIDYFFGLRPRLGERAGGMVSAVARPSRRATRASSVMRDVLAGSSSWRISPSRPKRSATTLCWWIVSRFSWRAETKCSSVSSGKRATTPRDHLAHAVLDEARAAVRLLDHRGLVGALHQLVDLRGHRVLDDRQQRRGVDVDRAVLGAADVQRAEPALVVRGDGTAR
jgi:hypothetical protein